MNRVVVIGSINTDMVVQVPHLPGPGETVLGTAFHQVHGGKGANQAMAAAQAGAQVAFVGGVGRDVLGAQALANLQAASIDTMYVQQWDGVPSGVALIMVDAGGENCISVAAGANVQVTPSSIAAADAAIVDSDVILLQLEIPLEAVCAAIARAHELGKTVVLNPAPAQPLPDALWPQLSLITPNRSEAALLTGVVLETRAAIAEAARVLRSKGVGSVLITLGGDGAYLDTGAQQRWITGKPVEVVDTTGAGDAFNGVLAAALAAGYTLTDAAQRANEAAAHAVTQMGAQSTG